MNYFKLFGMVCFIIFAIHSIEGGELVKLNINFQAHKARKGGRTNCGHHTQKQYENLRITEKIREEVHKSKAVQAKGYNRKQQPSKNNYLGQPTPTFYSKHVGQDDW